MGALPGSQGVLSNGKPTRGRLEAAGFLCGVLFLFFGLINNRNVFLTVMKAGKSKIKASADLVHGKDPLPG